jgi:hypothetical protein
MRLLAVLYEMGRGEEADGLLQKMAVGNVLT